MKRESFHIGVYWGKRKESIAQCADRAAMFFSRIAQIDPFWSVWRKKGWSREDSQERITVDREALCRLFEEGIHRRDSDKSPISELGFGLSLWTGGAEGQSGDVSISCGSYSDQVGNVCGMKLPREGDPADRILTIPALTQLFEQMVKCWEPDFGRITSSNCRRLLARPNDFVEVGWITYLSSVFSGVVPPASVHVQQLSDGGRLFIATEERFSSERDDHLEAVRRVAASVND